MRRHISNKEVVLAVTGSIAAYKACDIISALRKEEIEVQAVLTKDAQEFITPLSIQTLSHCLENFQTALCAKVTQLDGDKF